MLGWPTDAPRWACKRLPPFPSAAAADRFVRRARPLPRRSSRRAGSTSLETNVDRVHAARRTGRALLRPARAARRPVARDRRSWRPTTTPRGCSARSSTPPCGSSTTRVGLDAQLSNWAMMRRPAHLLRRHDADAARAPTDRSELDTEVFLASLPWALRGAGAPLRAARNPPPLPRPAHGGPGPRREPAQGASRRRGSPTVLDGRGRSGGSSAHARTRCAPTIAATPGPGICSSGSGAWTAAGSVASAAAGTRSCCRTASTADPRCGSVTCSAPCGDGCRLGA